MPTDNQLAISGFVGALVAALTLLPIKIGICVALCIIIFFSVVIFLSSRYETSTPTQWMLVLQNGELIKSGVGLRCFRWFNQQVVRFDSTFAQVDFAATNVTLEMSGVEIKGFCVFAVDRTIDKKTKGPLKYYQNVVGQEWELKNKIQTQCESILRHQIAKHELKQLLNQRTIVRDNIKADVQKEVKGWGIWIETIELTDVHICSGSLFTDMQSKFRNEKHLEATKINQETTQQIQTLKLNQDVTMNKIKEDQETERQKLANDNQIKQDEDNAKFIKKKNDIEKDKLEKQKEIDQMRQEMKYELNQDKQVKKIEIEKFNVDLDLHKRLKKLELEKKFDKVMMKKYEIDKTFEVYSSIPFRDLTMNQYLSPEESGSFQSMIPGIDKLFKENEQGLEHLK